MIERDDQHRERQQRQRRRPGVSTEGVLCIDAQMDYHPIRNITYFAPDVIRAARESVGHVGTTADVAAGALFLASPAASFVNGASILVDGGWTAQ